MVRVGWVLVRVLGWLAILGAGVVLLADPATVPGWVLAALAMSALVLVRAWREARGTALRASVVWAAAAVLLGMVAEGVAYGEPLAAGRPWAGHVAYLASLATLAALISVLNARRPGSGAWAFLMVLLVLVFLIPWFEGAGLAGSALALERLRLELPWNLFFGLLLLTGATNYLPTRHGPAALAVAVGLGLELAGLTWTDWPAARRAWVWTAAPWFLALALGMAGATGSRREAGGSGLERLWHWFRDRWGVVWALRVLERFNRSAEAARWPFRLAWSGMVRLDSEAEPTAEVLEAAEATLRGLLRRFADEDRLAEASRPGESP